MSKHEQNTYKEPTNKYLMLDEEGKKIVSQIASNQIRRMFEDLDELNSIAIQELKQEIFKSITNSEAIILFLQKELEGWKESAHKAQTRNK